MIRHTFSALVILGLNGFAVGLFVAARDNILHRWFSQVEIGNMKSTLRPIFSVAAAISFVFFILTAAMWIRSYLRWDMIAKFHDQSQIVIRSNIGCLSINFDALDYFVGYGLRRMCGDCKSDEGRLIRSNLGNTGFQCVCDVRPNSYNHKSAASIYYRLQLPYWFLLIIFGILPSIGYFLVWDRGNTHKGGTCPSCGYDLRASGERCPECGRTIERAN